MGFFVVRGGVGLVLDFVVCRCLLTSALAVALKKILGETCTHRSGGWKESALKRACASGAGLGRSHTRRVSP